MERILDAHCHIYPEKIAARAVEAIGKFYDIEMDLDGTVNCLIETGMKAGVTDFLVHSVATTPKQVTSINEFIASEVAKNPEHLIGFGSLHPDSDDLEGDIEHLLSLGLRGVKLHPDFQKFEIDSEKSVRMCKMFAGKIPLLIHAGDYRYHYSNPDNILRFLDKVPDITFIGAHFSGWSIQEEAKEKLTGIPNLYVDTSSSFYRLTDEQIVELIYAFGVDHVLFGTDYPMWLPEKELDRIRGLGLPEADLKKILFENAEKLLLK